VIELLAISDGAAPARPPLRAVPVDGLTVLCAPATERRVTPEALWRHEELLEELMRECDLLPVRYGTVVADEDAVARAVTGRRDELAAALERVRGAIELALRVEPRTPPPPVEAASGSEYMRAKAARLATARELHEPLAARSRAAVVKPGHELLRAAYLVERGSVDAFVAAVREQQRARPDLALLCTGPWPPYSFAEPPS
jgi:Gas vesicle synthesis protein GvpL/GvpF